MMGFTICFLQELIVGKGVLEQYGLPCVHRPPLSPVPAVVVNSRARDFCEKGAHTVRDTSRWHAISD